MTLNPTLSAAMGRNDTAARYFMLPGGVASHGIADREILINRVTSRTGRAGFAVLAQG
jgi:hypothetical protein